MDRSTSIRSAVILVCALSISVWLGSSIVTNQSETLIKFAAAILFVICIFLGRRIWLLLIFFSALNVPLIRGIGTTEVGQILFVGFTVLMTLIRRQDYNIRFGEKEIWVLLLAGCIVQVYLRNPVGLNMFGADTVGAQPYFMVVLAYLSSVFLANIVVNPGEIRWVFRLTIIGTVLGMALFEWRMRGAADPAAVEQGTQIDDDGGATRIGLLGVLASLAAKVSASKISPLRALRSPFWALMILFCLFAAAMSGYRNTFAYVALILLIGLAYRSGGIAVIVSLVAGAIGLALLSIVNVLHPLPANIQRTLSPFPGTWERRHVADAESSTEWRVEMWKEALLTDNWIKNKIFGDGLGFTRRELIMQQSITASSNYGDSRSRLSAQQEVMMINGGYHSGPVQTVRVVGYVGLVILLLAMCRMAVFAHRQIIRCRGTEWYPLALFMCIPMVIQPFFFVFIFGEFGGATSYLVFSYAFISLLEKNLPIPPYAKPVYMPYVLRRGNSPSF